MSTDGTQPPSIAPQRPAATPGGLRGPDVQPRPASAPDVQPRPASGPVSGSTPPSARATSPSFTERVKQSAQSVVEAARPTRTQTGPAPRTTPEPPPRTAAPRSAPQRTPAPRGASAPAPASSGPRKVRLAVAHVDPWSVMKLAFLLSFAVGIMIVVSMAVVWYTLDGLNVFTSADDFIATLAGTPDFFDVQEWASLKRAVSLSTMIAVVDVVLLTALATIGAFLYNIVAAMVGGIHLTLTDD